MDEKYGIKVKKLMFDELNKNFNSFPSFVVANYKGLSSSEVEVLRKGLRGSSSKFFVVKNSIAKRALDDRKLQDMNAFLNGQVGIGFCGDIVAACKTLSDFAKEHNSLKLNIAYIDGKIEQASRIKELAALPSRDVLLAMVVRTMKSPITGFVGTLKGVLRKFVYAVSEIKNKKSETEGGK
ncbi:MAG: 50S ribosomal protein L10 [Candidatus Omnitrophota bacterium]